MQTQHWLPLLVVFAVGVAFARYFPQIPQKIGLP